MKIVIRGGSIAAGKGVTRNYADIISDVFHNRKCDVFNRARYGETSFDCVETFNQDIEPLKPGILIIHYGIDDAYFPVYRSEFKENLVQTVRLARKTGDPVLMLMTSHPFKNYHDMDMIHIYYRTVREVAVDLGCELVPVHTWWQGYIMERNMSTSQLVQDDVRLPNQKGHEVYAEVLIERLKKYI